MNIALYCGSSLGTNPIYKNEAKKVINFLNEKKSSIVYGGSISGLMGVISQEAISLGMSITGVITYNLIDKEIENKNLSKIYRVDTLRERKEKMEELSDAFIALPGGFGTFEEISEVFTSVQISLHSKPCALLNINGYYDKLIEFFQTCVDEGFIGKKHLDSIIISNSIEEIYNAFENYQAPQSKWQVEK